MSTYRNLRQAAADLGCDKRTLLRYLHDAGISAQKSTSDKREMLVTVEDIARIRAHRERVTAAAGLQVANGAGVEQLLAEIADLRRRVEQLERRSQVARPALHRPAVAGEDAPSHSLEVNRPPRASESPTVAYGPPEQTPEGIPGGSVQFGRFIKLHGMRDRTVRRHVVDYRLVEVIERPDPTRSDGHVQRWLTPEQQHAAFAFWNRRGQIAQRCDRCPH